MALPPPSPESTALVTGASSGIGRAFARALAARGHGVTLVARRRERLEELAEELRSEHGVAADAVACDLSDQGARDELAAEVERLGRRVEVLVNNAGFGVYETFVTGDREKELRQVRVDVEAVVDLTARYLPPMVERQRGAVINMSSTSALQPLPHNAGYAAAKAHVLFFSEALWKEVRGSGVTVTAVLPGPVPTEFQEVNEADFAQHMPKPVWKSAETVAEKALRAAERGRRTVIPGVVPKLAFAPNRFAPKRVALAVAERIMR